MRAYTCVALLVAVAATVADQSPLRVQAPGAPEIKDITHTDLQGLSIHTSNTFIGRFRNAKGEAPGGFVWRMDIKFEPGGAVKWTSTRDHWADTPSGRKTGEVKRAGTSTMAAPGEARDGSGAAIWLLEANVLTLLRVFETGGATLKVSLRKGTWGFNCSAVAAMAQEIGAGPTRDKSGLGGGKVQVLSAKPTASSCRVSQD